MIGDKHVISVAATQTLFRKRYDPPPPPLAMKNNAHADVAPRAYVSIRTCVKNPSEVGSIS
jgi:hypothetical protein